MYLHFTFLKFGIDYLKGKERSICVGMEENITVV